MPPSSELLHEVKSQQNVLIARAGLSVPGHEMHGEDLNSAMFTQFKYHVLNSRHTLDAPENTFLRSSRHLDATCGDKDFHNGGTLWRKYVAIKKYVNNNITSIYVKHLGPDGQPPSGQTKADIFKKTRRDLFLAEQEESKAKSKNPASFKKKPFSSSWYPVQWGVFLEFGRGADHPERAFFLE